MLFTIFVRYNYCSAYSFRGLYTISRLTFDENFVVDQNDFFIALQWPKSKISIDIPSCRYSESAHSKTPLTTISEHLKSYADPSGGPAFKAVTWLGTILVANHLNLKRGLQKLLISMREGFTRLRRHLKRLRGNYNLGNWHNHYR